MTTTIHEAQLALAQLFESGVFNFSKDLDTISYEYRNELLNSLEPQPYEIAYQLGPINYIEKLNIDYNGSVVEMLRTETTWEYNKLRAFELEITELPSSIIIENEPLQQPKILTTTWWCNKDGAVISYTAVFNNQTLVKLGE